MYKTPIRPGNDKSIKRVFIYRTEFKVPKSYREIINIAY